MNLSTKIQAYESFFESNLPKEMVDSNLLSLTAQLKNSFFRQLNYYVLWKDKALSFGGCNQLFSRRFEFNKPCQVIGKTDHDFPWRKDLRKKYVTDDQTVLNTGIPKINFIEQQRQLDGSVKMVLVSKIPISRQTEIMGVLCIYVYVTSHGKNNASILLSPSSILTELTEKEKRCVYLLVKGYSAKKIGDVLGNSPRTIETHLENIKSKLHCYNRSQIIEKAFEEIIF